VTRRTAAIRQGLRHPIAVTRALVARHRGMHDYEALYANVAALALSDEDMVGPGDFGRVGAIELAILREAGLEPQHTLVDFGCGAGRLALHAVSFLDRGEYVGIDISQQALRRAAANVARLQPPPTCRVSWLHNVKTSFPLGNRVADVVCAFSVFTHIEHEDTYRYLADAGRLVRAGGRFVFSCLPLELEVSREVFLESAALPLQQRWRRVRNVTTSRDMMDVISGLAGWRVVEWYDGDAARWSIDGSSAPAMLGQSICVLQRP
jgi:SAM-dependent methyltransferase